MDMTDVTFCLSGVQKPMLVFYKSGEMMVKKTCQGIWQDSDIGNGPLVCRVAEHLYLRNLSRYSSIIVDQLPSQARVGWPRDSPCVADTICKPGVVSGRVVVAGAVTRMLHKKELAVAK